MIVNVEDCYSGHSKYHYRMSFTCKGKYYTINMWHEESAAWNAKTATHAKSLIVENCGIHNVRPENIRFNRK